MNNFFKINNQFKIDFYGMITLIILIFFAIGLVMFLYNSQSKISIIYQDIENKQKETVYLKSEIARLKYEKINYVFNLDMDTDSSIFKFVTSTKGLNSPQYIPENLKEIESDYIEDTKGGNQLIVEEANEALQQLGKDFYDTFGIKLPVVSAYRSYSYQQGIKAGGCGDNLCADPGYSEHQLGLAVDLLEASSQSSWKANPKLMLYYNWLYENAYFYGFTNTYQKGIVIDGYEIEPWHWRYLGFELAMYLKENNLTIAEFYKIKNK